MNSATHDQRATKKSNAVELPINVRPANYARWEGETLADAMAAAVSYPAHSWRIWAVMAACIREMNVDFRSQGEPELELRAGLRLRAEEWVVLQLSAVLVTAALVTVVLRSPVGLPIGGGLGYAGMRAFLSIKISRRSAAFEAQLPDMLQLIDRNARMPA